MSRANISFLIILTVNLLLSGISAQAQVFGLGVLLNPEGSRLYPQFLIYPRHPGKPDLRWRVFDWQFTDRSVGPTKYHLYFYPEEEWTARFAIPQIDQQIEKLRTTFHFAPKEPFSYVLFSTQRDFRQANVFQISEGVAGITSTTEATMAVPYWGDAREFQHVSTHEMVHQFQTQKANSLVGTGFGGFGSSSLALAPLWFIEGMAEYYSLNGVDPESRTYLRDLLVYPDPERDYGAPKFFESGPPDFIRIYKAGQAKIDFIEGLGKGKTQAVFDTLAGFAGTGSPQILEDILSKELGHSPPELERLWQDYLRDNYGAEAAKFTQGFDQFEEVPEVGDSLDLFAIAPSGEWMAIREVHPITGVVSIQILDAKHGNRRIEVESDRKSDVLSLYFMQRPGLAVSEDQIAYIVETVKGPELVVRRVWRESDGELHVGDNTRILLHENELNEASSPSFSPDGKQLAFIGVGQQGWQNVYVLDLAQSSIRQLTEGHYGWSSLSWGRGGILAASDQTPDKVTNIFLVNPTSGGVRQLTVSKKNQLAPRGEPENFVFQSWESDSSQIHLVRQGRELRLTDVKTELRNPERRNGRLYALGFKSGRFRLYRIPEAQFRNISLRPVAPAGVVPSPWIAQLVELPEGEVQSYRPFVSSGTRIDYLTAALGTGGYGILSGSVSDLMRNYNIYADFTSFNFGDQKRTSADAFFSSFVGRTKWTAGGYYVNQPLLDNIYSPQDLQVRTYLRKEFGALGALQYPFGAFSFIDVELRVAGTDRTDFSDPTLASPWDAQNPGTEFLLAPMLRYGYDSILYEVYTGPLRGFGVLLGSDTSYYPGRGGLAERLRLDAAQYWNPMTTTVLALVGTAGAAFGDEFNDPFLLSSDDIFRGYRYDDNRLYGNYYVNVKGEVNFPVGTLFKFPPLRGLLAYDVGSIFINTDQFGEAIASNFALGAGLNIPPLSFKLIWAFPIKSAPGPEETSVFHFTLRYLYL